MYETNCDEYLSHYNYHLLLKIAEKDYIIS